MLQPVVVLDAEMDVAAASDRLSFYDEESSQVAVRWRRRIDEQWFLLPRNLVRRRLEGRENDERLEEVLALEDLLPSAVHEMGSRRNLEGVEGLVLDQGTPVGYRLPRPTAAAPAAAAAPSPARGGGVLKKTGRWLSRLGAGGSRRRKMRRHFEREARHPGGEWLGDSGSGAAGAPAAAPASEEEWMAPRGDAGDDVVMAPAPERPVFDIDDEPQPSARASAGGAEPAERRRRDREAAAAEPAAPAGDREPESCDGAAEVFTRRYGAPAAAAGGDAAAHSGATTNGGSQSASPSAAAGAPAAPDTSAAAAAPEGVGGAAAAGDAAPTPGRFAAHPHLESPREVVTGEDFELVVGLSTRAPAAGAAPLSVATEADDDSFSLDLQLVAGRCTVLGDHRRVLSGRRSQLTEARATFRLRAPEQVTGTMEAVVVRVQISQAGLLLGSAERHIAVRSPAAAPLAEDERRRMVAREMPMDVYSGLGIPAPDLTVTVAKSGDPADRHFDVTFESPHPLARDQEPLKIDLGQDAPTFAKQVMEQIKATTGTPLLDNTLRGIGKNIAGRLTDPFWTLLRALQNEVAGEGRVLTVLWLSAESHVPWELALFPAPLLRPDQAPFLGAQVAFARWILGTPQPRIPPEHRVEVEGMAVVVGFDYGETRWWRELAQAKEEGKALEEAYQAHLLTATMQEVDDLLELRHPRGVGVIHFACHGKADPTTPSLSAIVLAPDGRPLLPMAVLGYEGLAEADQRPFVFLNACSVGTAGETLGEVAGFPGAFLRIGCRGFVAPLWEVNDEVAHRLALRLYEDAFGDVPVAESLRRWRGEVEVHDNDLEATPLAYVFYGHPELLLSRRSRPAGGPDE